MSSKEEDEAKEVAYWEEKFSACKAARNAYERQWYMNFAFYKGKQYVIWRGTDSNQHLYEPAPPRNRVRLVSNKCKPIVRRELTKLTREEPHFYVVPNTTEPSDVAAARAGESIADYSLRVGQYNSARRRATFWSLICGTAYVKTTCTEKNGPVEYHPVTAFHLFVPNLQEEDIENQPFVIDARARDPEEIFKAYGIEVKADTKSNGSTLEQQFLTALGIQGIAKNNLVYVKEIWVKPCIKYPKGALLVMCDGKIAYRYDGEEKKPEPEGEGPTLSFTEDQEEVAVKSDYPYDHGQYPYEKIDHIPTGGYYGDSVLVDIIPLQKEYNKARSQIIESRNRTSKPQITYDQGSLDPSKITSEAGLLIPIKPGFSHPKPLDYKGIEPWALQDQDRILSDMDDNTAQTTVSKGKPPPGIEAASAIAYLQEENDSILYHTVASIEAATEKAGKQTLSLVQQMWDEEKIVDVVSKNSTQDAKLFKAKDLKDNMDLRIEAGSMAPKSRAAKQAFITSLMKDGIIPPEKGLRYLELNETSRLYEELQVDARQAQRENIKMCLNEYPLEEQVSPEGQKYYEGGFPVNEFDDDLTHIYEHGLFMKSEQYELLEDDKKMVHLMHYSTHRGRYQAGLMAQNQQQVQPQNQGVEQNVSA